MGRTKRTISLSMSFFVAMNTFGTTPSVLVNEYSSKHGTGSLSSLEAHLDKFEKQKSREFFVLNAVKRSYVIGGVVGGAIMATVGAPITVTAVGTGLVLAGIGVLNNEILELTEKEARKKADNSFHKLAMSRFQKKLEEAGFFYRKDKLLKQAYDETSELSQRYSMDKVPTFNSLKNYVNSLRIDEIAQSEEEIRSELKDYSAKIINLNKEIESFKKNVSEQLKNVNENLAEYAESVDKLSNTIQKQNSRIKDIESRLAQYEFNRANLEDKIDFLKGLRNEYEEDSVEYQKLSKQISRHDLTNSLTKFSEGGSSILSLAAQMDVISPQKVQDFKAITGGVLILSQATNPIGIFNGTNMLISALGNKGMSFEQSVQTALAEISKKLNLIIENQQRMMSHLNSMALNEQIHFEELHDSLLENRLVLYELSSLLNFQVKKDLATCEEAFNKIKFLEVGSYQELKKSYQENIVFDENDYNLDTVRQCKSGLRTHFPKVYGENKFIPAVFNNTLEAKSDFTQDQQQKYFALSNINLLEKKGHITLDKISTFSGRYYRQDVSMEELVARFINGTRDFTGLISELGELENLSWKVPEVSFQLEKSLNATELLKYSDIYLGVAPLFYMLTDDEKDVISRKAAKEILVDEFANRLDHIFIPNLESAIAQQIMISGVPFLDLIDRILKDPDQKLLNTRKEVASLLQQNRLIARNYSNYSVLKTLKEKDVSTAYYYRIHQLMKKNKDDKVCKSSELQAIASEFGWNEFKSGTLCFDKKVDGGRFYFEFPIDKDHIVENKSIESQVEGLTWTKLEAEKMRLYLPSYKDIVRKAAEVVLYPSIIGKLKEKLIYIDQVTSDVAAIDWSLGNEEGDETIGNLRQMMRKMK